MGFRKCQFHRMEWDREVGKNVMVLDNYKSETRWDRELKIGPDMKPKLNTPNGVNLIQWRLIRE